MPKKSLKKSNKLKSKTKSNKTKNYKYHYNGWDFVFSPANNKTQIPRKNKSKVKKITKKYGPFTIDYAEW